ncbi:6914_t:CDS:2 [Racocetra fulgida]|uniref:6914_t:CDS:1 n=1 Tax=Racocetra fulgida TaxID=60492 RepID=A0A9N8Z4W7_9GLOM|nr:6914_t:CDS:2 [Racocetra fulgida]
MGELSKPDISAQFTHKLLEEATDINLKIRRKALNKILKIVDDNKQIGSNLGDLPRILKLRLSDNNVNLQIISLDICGKIATAMGDPFKKYATTFIDSVIEILKNKKNSIVHKHAIDCLNCFASAIGISSVEKILITRHDLLQKDLQVWLSNRLKDADKKNKLFKLQEHKEDTRVTDHDFKLKEYRGRKGTVKQRNDAVCLSYNTKPLSKEKDIKELGQKSNFKDKKNRELSILPKPIGSLAMHPDKKKKSINIEYSIPNNKRPTTANSSGISPTNQGTSGRDSLSLVKNNIKSGKLRPNKLLRDLNNFLLTTPPSEWEHKVKERMPLGEVPFNIIQILLKKLIEELGENVYDHLDLIPDSQRSNVYLYMKTEVCKGKKNKQLITM